jgi:hypothetical protein
MPIEAPHNWSRQQQCHKHEKSQKVPIKKLKNSYQMKIAKKVRRLMSAAYLGVLESVHV